MNKKRIRIIIAALIGLTIMAYVVINIVLASKSYDFEEWFYKKYVDTTPKIFKMAKPVRSYLLIAVLSFGLPGLFWIFALVYSITPSMSANKRKWPYITILVIAIVLLGLALFTGIGAMPVKMTDKSVVSKQHLVDLPQWKEAKAHWASMNGVSIAFSYLRWAVLAILVALSITGIVLTVKYTNPNAGLSDTPNLEQNQFSGFENI